MAWKDPTRIVETAGSIVGEVVGRDTLCDVLQSEIEEPDRRRPHVLVGGLGVGKTAVLLQLTKLLARRHAVPVCIRLRDAQDEIDFLGMARERFLRLVDQDLHTKAEGEKIWNQLIKDDRVVVLADGLEEAFADEEAGRVRNHRVRVAVRAAAARNYPLIIASRPHAALRALDAAITRLEPLSEDAALEYIRGSEPPLREKLATRLLGTAKVTEAPLYLRVAQELHAEALLEGAVKQASADRVAVRKALLDAWLKALQLGRLDATQDVPLDEAERRATVEQLSVLAYLGLRADTQQVTFAMWEPDGGDTTSQGASSDKPRRVPVALHDALAVAAAERLEAVPKELALPPRGVPPRLECDIHAAASKGMQLGLAEPITNGVRFQHSVLQAYLGARILGVAIENDTELGAKLQDPGRELLLACVLYARMAPQDPLQEAQWNGRLAHLVGMLEKASRCDDQPDAKRLDILSALVEIDVACAVHGIGASLNTGGEPGPDAHAHARGGVYETVGQPAVPDHSTRSTAAGPLALSENGPPHTRDGSPDNAAPTPFFGRQPFALGHEDGLACVEGLDWNRLITGDESMNESKHSLIEGVGDAALVVTNEAAVPTDASVWRRRSYQYLHDVAVAEPDYLLSLTAVQQIGLGGDAAWAAVRHKLEDTAVNAEKTWGAWADWLKKEPTLEDEYLVQGWLLPMLLGAAEDARTDIDKVLRTWLDASGCMPRAIEGALAQGFKHAANRRPHHSHENAESREILKLRAKSMLGQAKFWYSRLSLIQALCLWEVARTVYPGHGSGSATRRDEQDDLIRDWLKTNRQLHEENRFVREAAELARRALRTRRPEAYIWMDEGDVVSRVGSEAAAHSYEDIKPLWVPESAGWGTLDLDAQRLVADVLIVLNLAERGGEALSREQGLEKVDCVHLPMCITGARTDYLQPQLTAGIADFPAPGSRCHDGCRVKLCPYPSRGQQPYRVEFGQAFCRGQREALRHRRAARWQEGSAVELRRFWREMERRARI